MIIPRPNIEWHCVIPKPLTEEGCAALIDELDGAHRIFTKVTASDISTCTGVSLSDDMAILRFAAPRRFLSKLHRLDKRFERLTSQQRYELKTPRPEKIYLPGVEGRPTPPPTKAEVFTKRLSPRQALVQRAKTLGINAGLKSVVLEKLIAEKEAEFATAEAVLPTTLDLDDPKKRPIRFAATEKIRDELVEDAKGPGFAANTQTMGKGE